MKSFSSLMVCLLFCAAIQVEGNDKKVIEVKVTVPSGGWKLAIEEVYQVDKEIWVFSQLLKPGGLSTQAISQVSAKMEVEAPDLPVKHFVLGKTWGWKNKEPITFVASKDSLNEKLKGSKPLFKAVPPKSVKALKSVYIVGCKKEFFTDGKTKDGRTLQQVGEAHAKACDGSFRKILGIINGYTIVTDDGGRKKLEALPEVKFVEIDGPVR